MHGHLNGRASGAQVTAIRAELVGSDIAKALGVTVLNSSPLLQLCRELVAAGQDPATPLTAYRGNTLCLRIRSIGEAAQLEVASNTHGFIARDGLRPRSLVRSGRGGGAGYRPGNRGRR